MTTVLDVPVTRSLEDYRREQLLTQAEFAKALGMTEQTYRRLLADPESVRMPTKRRAREVLDVSPYLVREFSPLPSPTLVAQTRAAIEEANVQGWIAVNPDTLEPTGELFDGDGNLMDGSAT
ncbi:helix-turn-helix transcriptional regulator [Chloroflexales bacterium ZM16-3]|nr:helix-turn-helix transcriptional regulator [Chloroflexales bacterium ZM16-3]